MLTLQTLNMCILCHVFFMLVKLRRGMKHAYVNEKCIQFLEGHLKGRGRLGYVAVDGMNNLCGCYENIV